MTDFSKIGCFFDCDGVLIDSVGVKTEAFRILFAPYGEKILDQVLELNRLHGGISRVDKIKHSHAHFIGKPLSEPALKEWGRRYSELVFDQVIGVPWIKGAEEFLREMHGKCPIFVISGTPEEELKRVIKARKMDRYFNEILGSPTRKPEHIRNLLANYRLDPSSCVFIGDALTDYHAAKETGLQFVGIQGDIEFPEDAAVLPDCTSLKEQISKLLSRN